MIEVTARPADSPLSEAAPVTNTGIATRLNAVADAYARGDNPLAELLFAEALDDDLPWDVVCAAAARGIARRHDERCRG